MPNRVHVFSSLLVLCIAASPVFAIAPTITDADWTALDSTIFPGITGKVYAIVFRQGNLYIAGEFSAAGNIAARNIVLWDKTNWYPLGSGTDGTIYDIILDANGNIYAGGNFDTAGGILANNIAKWNGSAWTALGSGMNKGRVNALAMDTKGGIYAGGYFDTAGGVPANNIAKWDNEKWESLGAGIPYGGAGSDDPVEVCASDDSGNIYVGGLFSTAGDSSARNIAKWNGASWSALSTGVRTRVLSLACAGNGILYAGAQGSPIRKWDGVAWDTIGTAQSGITTYVFSLACNAGGDLYAGGYFYMVDSVIVRNIAKWDGVTWSGLGTGMTRWASPDIMTIAFDDSSNVFAGGGFDVAGNDTALNIAKWDGNAWSPLMAEQKGFDKTVKALAYDGHGTLYIGGDFTTTGSVAAQKIAMWDGSGWHPLGAGIKGSSVNALALDAGGTLYVAGRFDSAGGAAIKNIARWSNSAWSGLGSGINGPVYALAFDAGGNLYAGGKFDDAGGNLATCVAKWDGGTWSRLKAGMYGDRDTVFSLAGDRFGNIYAGGVFSAAGGAEAKYVAKWDGSDWSGTGQPPDLMRCLACDWNGAVYAGGSRTVSKWDGTQWTTLGSECLYYVRAVACANNGTVFAGGGTSTLVNGKLIDHLLYWDGTAWNRLGSGTDGVINALAISDSTLFAGGDFRTAGPRVCRNIASVNIHSEMAQTRTNTDAAPAMADVRYRLRHSTLFISTVFHYDRVALYSLSGRRLLEAGAVSSLHIAPVAPQPLLVRLYHGKAMVSTAMVLGELTE
jgi:hypothetical protein